MKPEWPGLTRVYISLFFALYNIALQHEEIFSH